MKQLAALIELTELEEFNAIALDLQFDLVKRAIEPYFKQWNDVLFSECIDYLEFAAKSKQGKAKQCTKGYSCGNGCISKNRRCRKENTSAAKQAQEWLQQNSTSSPTESLDSSPNSKDWKPPKITRELGSGENGVAGLTESGTVLKRAKNGDIPEFEAELTAKAAELGLAPKVIGASKSAIEMENLSDNHRSLGTYDFGELDLTPDQFKDAANSFSKLHQSGIAHGDAHEDNVFFSNDNRALKFIDYGAAKSSAQGDEFLDAIVTDIRSYAFILRTQFELAGNSRIPKTEIERAASQMEKLSGTSGARHRKVAQKYLDRLKNTSFSIFDDFQSTNFSAANFASDSSESLSPIEKRKIQREILKNGLSDADKKRLESTFKSTLKSSVEAYAGIVEEK